MLENNNCKGKNKPGEGEKGMVKVGCDFGQSGHEVLPARVTIG